MRKRLLMLAVLVATTTGCFEIQGKHTLYLTPDGTLTWTVLEEEIRLNDATGEEEALTADEFLDLVAANRHDAAITLAALHPSSLNNRILREEPPQAIVTEAHFPGIDRVYQNFFDLLEIPASAELRIEEERTRMEATFWVWSEEPEEPEEGDELRQVNGEILLALLCECRIVLTEGRFVEAVNFEIVEGGRVAIPIDFDTTEAEENNTPIVLSLTWTVEPEDGPAPGEDDALQRL